MQTAHLGMTGASSATSLLKFNVGTNVSAARECFGFAWLREAGQLAESLPGKGGSGRSVSSSMSFESAADTAESATKDVVVCRQEQTVGSPTKVQKEIEAKSVVKAKTIRPRERTTETVVRVPEKVTAENLTKASSNGLKVLSPGQGEEPKGQALCSADPQEGMKPQLETAQQPTAASGTVVRDAGAWPPVAQSGWRGLEHATNGVGRQSPSNTRQSKASDIPGSLGGSVSAAKAPMSKSSNVESVESGARFRDAEAVSSRAVAPDCHMESGNATTASSVPLGSHAEVISAVAQVSPSGHQPSATAHLAIKQIVANAASELPGAVQQSISSGPCRLDVAVFDSTHGWLRIRTELDARGQVTASLTAAGSTAHDSLRAAVPEMTHYLASESVSVSRIAVHRVADSSTATAAQADGQRGGGTADHSQREREMTNCGDAARRSFPEMEESNSGASRIVLSTGRWGSRGSGGAAALRGWLGGLSRVATPIGLGFGFGKNSGGWVNVSA